jgi:circadian clock protein KaiC
MIDKRGLTLGEPLVNFHGVLRGVPTMVGEEKGLLKAQAE